MNAMIRNGSISTLAALLIVVPAPARGQQVSDARVRELVRLAAEQSARGQSGGQAAPAQTPAATDTRPAIRLSLDEAVKFALDRNLDIAVQRLNPQINDISISAIRSIYHPALTSTVFSQSQTNPATSTIAGSNTPGDAIVNGTTTYNAGVSQSVPWGGGNLSIQFNNSRSTTTNQTNLYNPAFNSFWSGQYTQPLMRGFRTDGTRQQLQVTKLNRDISDVQLRASITNTL